ncbi:MAG: type II secretion system secretin GspD [Phenylobacterium sp.]|nr:type II secretion system secretin GspD [Phenylobacterium sp.]
MALVLRSAFAAAVILGAAAPLPAGSQTRGAEAYTFAFQNADIAMVVQEVLGQAGQPYVLDPAVSGRISFRIEQRLTRDQLLAALEAVLAANNVAMVRNGDQLMITPQAKARSTAEIQRSPGALRGSGYEMIAVPLGYAQPSEVARALEAIAAADTVLYSNDKLGLLLLGGSGTQLKAALETLKIFDQSAFQDSKIRWYELGQAQATTVSAELERIVQGAGLVGVAVVPLRRLNGVIVFGRSEDSLNELDKWVRRLDTPGRDMSSNLFVYRPQFATAESLARTLGGLFGGSGGSASAPPPVAPGPSGGGGNGAAQAPVSTPVGGGSVAGSEEDLRISVDRESNTLLVFAAPSKWVQVQRVLSEIDRSQRQILIEASIVEVTLGRTFRFGVDWNVFSDNLQVGAVTGGTSPIPRQSFPGFSASYLSQDIAAALTALGSRTSIEVISAPKIIALDNRTARLQVGDQVPVVTQRAQSTSSDDAQLVNSIDYRSTGVILNVTPRISGDNKLILDVSQEVSSVGRTNSSGIDSPTIQQRRFESTLLLEDGGTIALGGLISSTRGGGDTGVPGLKDLPGVGALFRTQNEDRSRSELIVLLSARIIGDPAAAQRAMIDLAEDMRELERRGLLPAL